MGCVYIAVNKLTGKKYIGKASSTLDNRRSVHAAFASVGKSSCVFHNALRKYGVDGFSWRVLVICDDDRILLGFECLLIYVLKTKIPGGYNMTDGGEGARGRVISPEHRRKLSEALLGHSVSDETREKIRQSKLGRKMPPMSAKHKAKISAARKGKKLAPETIEKMRKAMLGRKLSEAHKQKISRGMRGKRNCLGRTLSAAHRKKVGLGMLGKQNCLGQILTEGHRDKIAAGVRRYHREKKQGVEQGGEWGPKS